MIVPLVAMRDAPDSALNVSLARLVGVVAGLSIGIAVLAVLRPSAGTVALVLALALAVGIVLRVGGAMNVQVAASALLVFANADPSAYAVGRLWETAVGAAVTVVLSPLLLPTNPARAFVRALHDVADRSAENLLLAADLLALSVTEDARSPALQELSGRLETRVRWADEEARTLPARRSAARRAVRLHPVWRRRHAAELDHLERAAGLAPEVAALVRTHVADVLELTGRSDTREWRATAPPVRVIVAPLAEAVTAALTGRPEPAALDSAAAALRAHAGADGTRFGAVLRRPLSRMIAELGGPRIRSRVENGPPAPTYRTTGRRGTSPRPGEKT